MTIIHISYLTSLLGSTREQLFKSEYSEASPSSQKSPRTARQRNVSLVDNLVHKAFYDPGNVPEQSILRCQWESRFFKHLRSCCLLSYCSRSFGENSSDHSSPEVYPTRSRSMLEEASRCQSMQNI